VERKESCDDYENGTLEKGDIESVPGKRNDQKDRDAR
jgi:hypothetical protein